jgi:hypothetical protein
MFINQREQRAGRDRGGDDTGFTRLMRPPELLDLVADNGLDGGENPPVVVGVVDGTSAVDLADVLAQRFLRRGRRSPSAKTINPRCRSVRKPRGKSPNLARETAPTSSLATESNSLPASSGSRALTASVRSKLISGMPAVAFAKWA